MSGYVSTGPGERKQVNPSADELFDMTTTESISVIYLSGIGRRMLCPECGNPMPISHSGECSRCGTHYNVQVSY